VRRFVVRHPLRPYDPRYFTPSAPGGLFTYDRAQLRAARAHLTSKRPPPPFLEEELPSPGLEERGGAAAASSREGEQTLSLEVLERFWRLPCEFLLKERLGLFPPGEDERLEGREPATLQSGLPTFQVRDHLLRRFRSGGTLQGAWEALSASALLPLGEPGRAALGAEEARIEPLLAFLAPLLAEAPLAPVAVALRLGDVSAPIPWRSSLRLTGWLRGLFPGAQILARAGSVRATDQLEAWIRHLTLSALGDGRLPGSTLVAGVGGEGKGAEILRFERLPAPQAVGLLRDLSILFFAGQRVPLRLFPQSSLVFADSLPEGPEVALRAASKVFFPSGRDSLSESEDPSIARLFSAETVLDEALGLGPEGERVEAFSFAALARRVYGPLLAARREGPP
jgi:exodeoxyribonuclease V gamma subunit